MLSDDEIKRYYPELKTRYSQFKDQDGKPGKPVKFYRLSPLDPWITENHTKIILLRAKVQAAREKSQ